MSLIEDLKPKMEEEKRKKEEAEKAKEKELKNKPKPKYTAEEAIYHHAYRVIKNEINKMVSNEMNRGNPPPDINHYYYSYDYVYSSGYSDIADEEYFFEGLDDRNFTVFFPDKNNNLLYAMKEKLEDVITSDIGYKYCEVKIEDKIEKFDEKYSGLFGGDKHRIIEKRGKAIWIHASMNENGFSSVKSKGHKVRYFGPHCYRDDPGSYGMQKYKACKESGRDCSKEWYVDSNVVRK